MKTVDIRVVQVPTEVVFECPECKEEIEMKYTDFCDVAGEVCDWKWSKIECPECKEEMTIDYVDWD